jgi:hypothetical protein
MGFFQSIGDTGNLIKQTFQIIQKNPSIIKPTILEGILLAIGLVCFLGAVLGTFFLAAVFPALASISGILFYAVIFLFIFLFPFLGRYLHAAQAWMVYETFTGTPATFSQGMARAGKKVGGIVLITFIDVVVGNLVSRARNKSGGRNGIIGFIIGIFLAIFAKALEEAWDLIGNYLLPAFVIEEKKVMEVVKTIPNMKNNIPAALVGVFGIDFVGSIFMGGVFLVGFLGMVLGVIIGVFAGTWIPLIVLVILFIILIVLGGLLVNMVKTVYFTLFYVAVTRPSEIRPEFRDEVTGYLTYSRDLTTTQKVVKTTQNVMSGKPMNEGLSNPSAASKETPEEIAEKVMVLIPYVKQYRSQGMLDEEIIAFLIEHEWPEYIVKKAIKNA